MRPIRFRARALAVVAASALAVPLLSACDPSGYAAEGKHFSIPVDRFLDDLHTLNKDQNFSAQLRLPGTGGPQTFSAAAAAQLLQFEIYLEMFHVQVAEEKIAITPADSEAADSLFSGLIFASIPGKLAARLKSRFADRAAVQRVHADDQPDDARVQRFYDAIAAARLISVPLDDQLRDQLRGLLVGLGSSSDTVIAEHVVVNPRFGRAGMGVTQDPLDSSGQVGVLQVSVVAPNDPTAPPTTQPVLGPDSETPTTTQ